MFKELKEDRIIGGGPHEVTEEIQSCQDELVAKNMFFRVYYLSVDPEQRMRWIKLCGE